MPVLFDFHPLFFLLIGCLREMNNSLSLLSLGPSQFSRWCLVYFLPYRLVQLMLNLCPHHCWPCAPSGLRSCHCQMKGLADNILLPRSVSVLRIHVVWTWSSAIQNTAQETHFVRLIGRDAVERHSNSYWVGLFGLAAANVRVAIYRNQWSERGFWCKTG